MKFSLKSILLWYYSYTPNGWASSGSGLGGYDMGDTVRTLILQPVYTYINK